jgi:hypothetical protein
MNKSVGYDLVPELHALPAGWADRSDRRDARPSREGRKVLLHPADNPNENGIIVRHGCGVFLAERPMMALQVLAEIRAH